MQKFCDDPVGCIALAANDTLPLRCPVHQAHPGFTANPRKVKDLQRRYDEETAQSEAEKA